MKRIAAAFDWQGVMAPANFRIDAWVTPPTYTGKPPVILPGLRPGEPVQTAAALAVPAGSTLVDPRDRHPSRRGRERRARRAESRRADRQAPQGTEERRFVINEAGSGDRARRCVAAT